MEDSKILLLEQELHSYKQQTEKKIEELKQQINDNNKRILTIEKSKEKTDFQYEQIMETLKTLNEKTIPNLTAQIEELKNKPIKRYDTAISAILGSIFGAVGAIIAGLILKP